jgi:hypothetical protein
MKIATTAVAGLLALAAVAAPRAANADCRGCVAAGVVGGLAAGAVIGGAIANSAPPPGYVPAYAAPVAVACAGGGYGRDGRWSTASATSSAIRGRNTTARETSQGFMGWDLSSSPSHAPALT